MEDSFNAQNFNAKSWLLSNLELATPESLDVQLSELNFNLDQYKHQLEEAITTSQTALQKRGETIEENLKEVSKEYELIQMLLDNQIQKQDMLNNIKLNEEMFVEINEISIVKSRLNDTLSMMDLIMSLDFNLDEILVLLEEKNLKELQEKMENLGELFVLIAKLPFLDSRREKYEIVIQKTKEFITQVLTEKFQENERIHPDLSLVYKILRIIHMEYLFLEYYNRMRFDRLFKNFVDGCSSAVNENLDFLEIFCETLKKEIDYLSELSLNKLSEVASELLTDGINRILKYLIENFFLKAFNQNKYQEKILNFLMSYLKIIKFLSKQIEQGIILNRNHVNLIENCSYSLFVPISNNIIQAEFNHNSKVLLKKIRKNQERSQDFDNFEEKILDFDFLKLPEIIELSFHRVHELLFGTELDEWVLGIHKICEEMFQKFQRVLDELDFRSYNHPILDSILIFAKGLVKKEDSFNDNEVINGKKFQVSENFGVIELMLNKFEEMIYLEDQMNKLDKEIRMKIHGNSTSNFQDVFIKIQRFLLENNSALASKRKNLILSLKTGLFIFEGVFIGINKCKEKIKKILLKIFLSDSLLKMVEMKKLEIWNESEPQLQIMSFNKITDQVSAVCQNFFMHIQIIEEIKNELERNSLVSNYLDHLEVTNKKEVLENLYHYKLKYEVYSSESDVQDEEIEKEGRKEDLVRFWGTVYVHFLVKIYCLCFKGINELGITGRKQVKMDIEYIINVLNEYLGPQSKKVLEEILSYIHANDNKKNIFIKGTSYSNIDFI